jgi:aminoglycoside 6'-N-acetyltransferase
MTDHLFFRPLSRRYFSLLSQWMAAPHVHRWWREEFDNASIEARYGPAVDGTDTTECFIVERDGMPIGFIQRYLLRDNRSWQGALVAAGAPEEAAGIDYLIGRESLIGNGLGPEIIGDFVAATWRRYPDITTIVVDVSTGNVRSWRALEKAGFHRFWTGTLPSEDPSDDGPSHVYLRHRAWE